LRGSKNSGPKTDGEGLQFFQAATIEGKREKKVGSSKRDEKIDMPPESSLALGRRNRAAM